jgi:hypothetical protein
MSGGNYVRGREPESKADRDAVREYERAFRRLKVAEQRLARRGLIAEAEPEPELPEAP